MTTLTELAHMLIAVERDGTEMQARRLGDKVGGWFTADPGLYNLVAYEYRLKPRTVYYRLFPDDKPSAIPTGCFSRLKEPPIDWQQRDDCIDIEREET